MRLPRALITESGSIQQASKIIAFTVSLKLANTLSSFLENGNRFSISDMMQLLSEVDALLQDVGSPVVHLVAVGGRNCHVRIVSAIPGAGKSHRTRRC